jgi:CheY-like chemotaxis protein
MNIPRILVVDDDPFILSFIQANLEARSYKVLIVTNGAEAVQIAAKEKPDLTS